VLDSLSLDFGVPVIEAYGMTECPHITCNPPDAPRYGSVGGAVVEELVVVDNNGRPVPAGEWGQVVLRGAPLMSGYLDHVQSNAAFRDSWFQTGDEGCLDPDGYLYLRGRFCERINRGGAMVIPADVDAALLEHPDIRQAVAFAVPHPSLGEDLAAAVVSAPDMSVDEAELRAFLSGRLEPRQVPSRIVTVQGIPVGDAGKVVRGGLVNALIDELYVGYEAPHNGVEELVVKLFDTVLSSRLAPGRKLGRLNNFFLEGGDSLAGVHFMALLARAGWGEHPPTLLFDEPTPAGLARVLESSAHAANGNLVALQPAGEEAPLFIVHGVSGQTSGYVELARLLGPSRPVFGIHNAGFGPEEVATTSVTALAEGYAEQILQCRPTGPIHLLGFSSGGWYAHAVAAALLERGAQVATLALLDSHGIHRGRRERLVSLPRRARAKVARVMSKLIRPPSGRQRSDLVGATLNRVWISTLYLARSRRAKVLVAAHPTVWPKLAPFHRLLESDYHPPSLPVVVDVFGPPRNRDGLTKLWRQHASRGVRYRSMFDDHHDFTRPELMSELAAALQHLLAEAEGTKSPPTTPDPDTRTPAG
jgi:thioesterase domain-containing protein